MNLLWPLVQMGLLLSLNAWSYSSPHWQKAINSFNSQNCHESARAMGDWIREAKGIHSPAAFRNLAYANSLCQNYSMASLAIWAANRFEVNPLKKNLDYDFFFKKQLSLGLDANMLNRFSLSFLWNWHPNWSFVVFFFGFWVLGLGSLFKKKIPIGLGATSIVIGVLSLGLYQALSSKYGVLWDNENEKISIYSENAEGKMEALTSLPRGSLVEKTQSTDDRIQITSPAVAGWVLKKHLRQWPSQPWYGPGFEPVDDSWITASATAQAPESN